MKAKILPVMLTAVLNTACRKAEPLKDELTYPAAFVVNGEGNSISVINLETNTVVQTADIKKGSWPHHIYTNDEKTKVVISLTGTDMSGGHAGHGDQGEASYIMVLRTNDFKAEAFEKTGHPAHNAIFVNDEIWLPQIADNGEVIILDAEKLNEKQRIAVGKGPLEITTDINGTNAYVANGGDNSISVISIASKEVVKTIAIGNGPVGAWPGADNNMYVDCETAKKIMVIDCGTLAVTDTINLTYAPAFASYNKTNSQLWIADTENGGVRRYEQQGGNWVETGFLGTGANAHAIVFNTTEDRAYITNQDAGTVSVIDVPTFMKITDIPVGASPNGIVLIE